MYQTVQVKREAKTKYDNGNNYVVPSQQRKDIINSQPVKQLAVTPLSGDNMRISYRSNKPSMPHVQHNVVQLQPTSDQESFIKGILTNSGKFGINVKITESDGKVIVECRIPDKGLSSHMAMKRMASLQQQIYNLYVSSSLPASGQTVLVRYYVDYKVGYKDKATNYMQEVVYSHSGAGYVSKECNDKKTTIIKEYGNLTGIQEDLEKYPSRHGNTGDKPWITLLENGEGTGDNGSKLTAENARFQLLMDDQGTSDDTWYLLSTQNNIICVNALNLTSNFMHVMRLRVKNGPNNGPSKYYLPIRNGEIANAIEQSNDWEGTPVKMSNNDFVQAISEENQSYHETDERFDPNKQFQEFLNFCKDRTLSHVIVEDGNSNRVFIIEVAEFLERYFDYSKLNAEMPFFTTLQALDNLANRLRDAIYCGPLDQLYNASVMGNSASERIKRMWFHDRISYVFAMQGCYMSRLVYASDFKFPHF